MSKKPRTDAEIIQTTKECGIEFKRIRGEATLILGPTPSELNKGETVPIVITRKAARRLLVELAKVVAS